MKLFEDWVNVGIRQKNCPLEPVAEGGCVRIDLSLCNLKTCRKQFDGNCTDRNAYSRCPYKNPWIPVSADLPEESGFYLCTLKNGLVCKLWYEKDKWEDEYVGIDYTHCVVAWMEIPVPYKPED